MSNIGRGPVDFKVSRGVNLRAHLELKLAKNTRWWHGLEEQLPTYQFAEGVDDGYFVVIALTAADMQRIAGIQDLVKKVRERTQKRVTAVVVDARPKRSASRV